MAVVVEEVQELAVESDTEVIGALTVPGHVYARVRNIDDGVVSLIDVFVGVDLLEQRLLIGVRAPGIFPNYLVVVVEVPEVDGLAFFQNIA